MGFYVRYSTRKPCIQKNEEAPFSEEIENVGDLEEDEIELPLFINSKDSDNVAKEDADILDIIVTQQIDKDLYQSFIENLLELRDRPEVEIRLYIHSPGGDIISGLGLYYLLKKLPNRKVGINIGYTYSAAMLPFLACDDRVSVPFGSFLIHDTKITFPAELNMQTIATQMRITDFENTIINKILCREMGIPENELEKYLGAESYFTPEEALQLNIIHRISEYIV